jgi:hypothetical protein
MNYRHPEKLLKPISGLYENQMVAMATMTGKIRSPEKAGGI